LYEKDKTIIDVNDGIDQIIYKLKYMADNYDDYKNNVINKYNQVVDFDREFIEVKKFIENLI
jgi:flagellar biosynthesis chaperone FliJ